MKPRRVFVNSMSGLFHADVPFEFIDGVLRTATATPQHTYMILTKRVERMAAFFKQFADREKGINEKRVFNAPWHLPNLQI